MVAWSGICHAWAPPAILEPVPQWPVITSGVTFQPLDIKALLSPTYDSAEPSATLFGHVFDNDNTTFDANNRSLDQTYRDLNPGFFHIAMTNLIEKLQKGFVLDVDPGQQVWS
ncbi:TPA: hypothetical protein N0F65_011102 [Lagenidium giganteum]|uniref:Uncharacterized protein n=1 Tax=Lagenidium giganteum TaxID=4803 RepID=A0AAV2ZFG0_9STRA|nr:TPA: hypothetical protein N0F65_011102 [Lagenidium giganteum]